MSPTLQHFSHRHPLNQLNTIRDRYNINPPCNLCGLIIDSNQICYDCSFVCFYSLHKPCAELPQYVDHRLHPDHDKLMLKRRSSNDTTLCYYCDNSFRSDETLAYVCNQCSFHMHTACAVIPIPTLTRDNNKDDDVQYFCHQLPMKLVEHDSSKDQAKCFVCQSPWSNTAYSCSSEACKNFLHYSCANLKLKIDQHPLHSNHPLMLQFNKPSSCNLCCKTNCRLIFRCQDGCNFNLCTECVVPKPNVRFQSHDHSLYFIDKAFYKGVCDSCQKSYTQASDYLFSEEVNRTRFFLFRCMECDFNLHFLCGPLPSVIKFDFHIHSLTLVDQYTSKYGYDRFCCDICEEERNPYFRMYCCGDCDYTAHIHCLLSEIMKVIKEKDKNAKLVVLGESQWSQFDQENDAFMQNVTELTLGEMIQTQTTDEDNKILNAPFLYYNPEYDKTYLEESYRVYRQMNSPLFDHELRSIEDIYKTHQFSSFSQDELDKMWIEIGLCKAGERLEIDGKYMRQKCVDVKGYKVPITVSPLFNTLLHRYSESDLFGPKVRSWSPVMKSIMATVLCDVCDRMCKTKIEDVTIHDLQHWFFCLYAMGRDWRYGLFANEAVAPVYGFEAIRYKKDISDKLDSRILELEAELEKCKKKREMFKMETFHSLNEDENNYIKKALEVKGKCVDQIFDIGKLRS